MSCWNIQPFALAYIATRRGAHPMVLIASSLQRLRRLMKQHVEDPHHG